MPDSFEEVRRGQKEFEQQMRHNSRYQHKKNGIIVSRSEHLDINGRAIYEAFGVKIPAYFVETSSDFEDVTVHDHSLFRTEDGVKVFPRMRMYKVEIETNKTKNCFRVDSLDDYDPTKFKYFDQYCFLEIFEKSNKKRLRAEKSKTK